MSSQAHNKPSKDDFDDDNRNVQTVYLSMVCFVAALGGFLFGFDTAVISGAIGYLKTQFQLNAIQEGWAVSSALIGCIVGALTAGMISDRFGRKKILILSALLFLISAIGSAVPSTIPLFIAARLVGGVGVGMASMLSPLYISEISPPHLRGRLVALYQLAITIGILVAYFSNALIQSLSVHALANLAEGPMRWIFVDEVWRGMFAAEVLPATLFLLLLTVVPESPRWLSKQGKFKQAEKILGQIVGQQQATLQIAEIRSTIEAEEGSLTQLLKPGLRIALLIGILLPWFSQVSGINVIIYYGPKIFEHAGLQISESLGGQVIIGFINMLFTFVAIAVVDRFGRKPLLYIGVIGMVVALVSVGLVFTGGETSGTLLLSLFILFIACFAFSLGPLCWIIISEIFPTRIRGRAMAIGTFTVWTSCTLVAQTFPWLLEYLGPAGSFWLYAVLVAPALPVTYWLVPETKNRSLEEIEKSWQ